MTEKELFVILLYQWLETVRKRYEDDMYYINRGRWWQGYDVYSTFEALEAKIRLQTYQELRRELLQILDDFGSSNYTK